jgi:hypothetical protein
MVKTTSSNPSVSTANLRTARLILPVVAGIVAGVAGSVFMAATASRSGIAPRSAVRSSERVGQRTEEPSPRVVESHRLDKVRRALSADATETETNEAAAAIIRPPTPTDVGRHVQTRIEQIVQRHASESVDSDWATGAESDFHHDLSSLGEKEHFSLVDLNCRTSLCIAVLQWPSYEAASQYDVVSSFPYKRNCAITVYVPLPEHGDIQKTYRSRVFFDCAEERTASR